MNVNATNLTRATRSELVKALDALPAYDPLRIDIRHELALRIIAATERQRIAKRQAAEVRTQLRYDRVTLQKAAASDVADKSDEELKSIAFTTDDPAERLAALQEVGRRSLSGGSTSTRSTSKQPVRAKAETTGSPTHDQPVRGQV